MSHSLSGYVPVTEVGAYVMDVMDRPGPGVILHGLLGPLCTQ